MNDNEYISLEALAGRLNLSRSYVRKQAKSGAIPYLNVNGRKRFREKSVRAALDKLEQQTGELQFAEKQLNDLLVGHG